MIFENVGGVGLALGEAVGDGAAVGDAVGDGETVGVGVCACAEAPARTVMAVSVSSAEALRARMERVIFGNGELNRMLASAGEFSSQLLV
jgi:hypothetical protein